MAIKGLTELFGITSDESHMLESDTGYIYNTMIKAVQDKLIGGNLLALRLGPNDIHGKSVDVQLQDRNAMVTLGPIAEGAEIPQAKQAFSELTYTPLKYGGFPLITEEMIEDNKFAVLDLNIKEAGYQMARIIDKEILKAIETGADAASHNSACTGLTLAGINTAMEYLELDGYNATDLIVAPGEAKDLRQLDVFNDASKTGSGDSAVNTKLIGSIYGGMKVWETLNINTPGDALILDRSEAICLAEKRPITIKNYDATTRDMRGAVATMRMAAGYLRKEACCTITVS